MAGGTRTAPATAGDLAGLTVLCLLSERPRHQYEMVRLVTERHKDMFISGLPRSLYRAVDRLAEAGLVEPVETNRDGRRPERTIFQVTPEGREEFSGCLAGILSVPERGAPVFAGALSLLGHLPWELAERALHERLVRLEGQIADLGAQLRVAGTRLEPLRLLELDYVRTMRHSELAWIRQTLARLGGDRSTDRILGSDGPA